MLAVCAAPKVDAEWRMLCVSGSLVTLVRIVVIIVDPVIPVDVAAVSVAMH